MSKVVRTTFCPECRKRGKDSRGDNLVEYADGGSHCFSCGYHTHGTVKSFFNAFKEPEEKHGSKVLPFDFTREVEPEGWRWLLQWGLPYHYWKAHIGYSPAYGRLVFPVGPEGSPAFSVGRLIDKERDPNQRKWFVWGDCHSHGEILGAGRGTVTVLVEDLISAHKVGQVAESMPLFGTAIYPAHLQTLRKASNRPVMLWLDKDQEGTTNKKALRLQMLLNRPVRVVHTQHDPKALSLQDIQETLQ